MSDASPSTALTALAERIELWSIEGLRPNERNPRTHSEAQVDQIAASMVEFGWTNPVPVDEDGGCRQAGARASNSPNVDPGAYGAAGESQRRAGVLTSPPSR